MEIWHGLEQVPANLDASVVTIGVFDGIHRGHRKLIGAAKDRARELGIPCVLMTFDPHPLAVVAPDHMPPMLGSVTVRADLAEDLGVDYMLAVRFTPELAAQNPEEFFTSVIMQRLHARAVMVGENFTFGHRASGNTDTLRELGEKYGVEVDVVTLLTEDGTTISSSVIRQLLREGDVAHAAWALGARTALLARWFGARAAVAASSAIPQQIYTSRIRWLCLRTVCIVAGSRCLTTPRLTAIWFPASAT